VAAFAAYAEHMATDEFEGAIRDVVRGAAATPTALMCAEARPEQCHRRLIADWLVAQGHQVVHLLTATRSAPHVLAPFARLEGGGLIYDGAQG
jgi:uncharacterized protein (DUF488 family)